MKVSVREISSKGPSSLIEWKDGETLRRANVPTLLLSHEDGEVFMEDPDEGAPYGEAWEALIEAVKPELVATFLRQSGIWTYEDFLKNTPVVSSAFREACTVSYQKFVQAVHSRQSVREGKE